jgi:photosystem II stability/assembly factor-like uncharacterized protein
MRMQRVLVVVMVLALAGAALPVGAQDRGQDSAVWVHSLPPVDLVPFTSLSLHEGGVGQAFFGAADVPGSRLLRTDDGGLTYSYVQTSNRFGPSTKMRFASPDVGWAADRELQRTEDGGATWTPVPVAVPEGTQLVLFDALHVDEDVVAVGMEVKVPAPCGEQEQRRNVLSVTRDGGESWSVHELGFESRFRDVHFGDAQSGAAIARQTRTTSSPSTLGPVALPVLPESGCTTSFSEVAGSARVLLLDGGGDPRTALLCGAADCHEVARPTRERVVVGMGDGTVMVSEDAGATFDSVTVIDRDWFVTGIAFADELNGWLSTGGHGLFRTDDGGRTWAEEISPQQTRGSVGRGDLAVAPDGGALVAGTLGVLRRVALD